MRTLALDIGATKIAVALLNEEHQILERSQLSSQPEGDLWPLVEEVIKDHQVTRIGVASAGPIDRERGTISPVNIAQWRNFPIMAELDRLFPGVPAGLLGDGTAVALAESRLGAGVGVQSLLGVVVSTGIGGGLVIDGKAFHGDTGNAALFGHHAIGFNSDMRCECGRMGCLESFARGPKMVEYAQRLGWSQGEDFIALAESARQGDSHALEAIDKGSLALAVGITNVLNIMDIHTVIIGGGVSFAGDIYWKPFLRHFANESKFARYLDEVTILPAKLRADAGLIGASLFAEEFV